MFRRVCIVYKVRSSRSRNKSGDPLGPPFGRLSKSKNNSEQAEFGLAFLWDTGATCSDGLCRRVLQRQDRQAFLVCGSCCSSHIAFSTNSFTMHVPVIGDACWQRSGLLLERHASVANSSHCHAMCTPRSILTVSHDVVLVDFLLGRLGWRGNTGPVCLFTLVSHLAVLVVNVVASNLLRFSRCSGIAERTWNAKGDDRVVTRLTNRIKGTSKPREQLMDVKGFGQPAQFDTSLQC